MNIIVAGQRIVTDSEFLEVATGFGPEIEPLDIEADFTAGGLASRDALTSFLADLQVETDTDREDAAYYKSLLRRMPRELRTRKTTLAAVVATELEAADDALGYEADDITADWTSADFDSYEVLATLGAPDPAAAVARARQPRAERRAVRAALSIVRTEIQAEVAA
ncbi:hypothetical protein QFZ56_008073 [Streptomyces achromogenes]|uniref:Uncharacterized protein n=1 Tax=Streptomyces achromogenes TaxID=67255 RepID=A0ABU0QED4_STRAH|nr:hypothetical protein [Streptomyces achromogenes]MDQ0689027.1 hypothetical protein [Streptomyces achromogenes]